MATLDGGENDAQKYAQALTEQVAHDRDGVMVRAGGKAMIYAEITRQSQRDLLTMEMIAVPLSFVVLVWVFGGLVAAALPMGGPAGDPGSMSMLRLITFATDVSIFGLNISTALDRRSRSTTPLLIISRYREEIAAGDDRDAALVRTMVTAGRTVLFSAITVALSMAAMILFPMYFLKSLAYAGIATVAFAAAAAVIVTPAMIVLLGDRLTRWTSAGCRALGAQSAGAEPKPVERQFWYRSTKFVMRRAVTIGLTVTAFLIFLGLPFLRIQFGNPDDRVLPRSASTHQVGDLLREDFPATSTPRSAW